MSTQHFGSEPSTLEKVAQRFFQSRFFLTALVIHVIFVIVVGGTIIVAPHLEPPRDFEGSVVAVPEGEEVPPRPHETDSKFDPVKVSTAIPTITTVNVIQTIHEATVDFQEVKISTPATPAISGTFTESPGIPKPESPTLNPTLLTKEVLQDIKTSVNQWRPKGRGTEPVTEQEVHFVAYVAKYGKGNDWASTNWYRNGKIEGGSLSNLLYFMNNRSKGKIKAEPEAVPLDLSSDELLVKRPPFIFFTGHQDFVLSEKEVANLRRYILIGGCIWGDSSLPGRRSRFDIAFRREMRRVISDADKEWEELPAKHPMFTRNLYYRDIVTPPKGLNYYQEPVYALKFGGEVAVIYTANDYGDMWQIGLDAQGTVDFSRNEKNQLVALNQQLWSMRDVYFRNLEQPAVLESYKFGTNVVFHLLTRWDERLAKGPSTL